jgi:hypothetical protein
VAAIRRPAEGMIHAGRQSCAWPRMAIPAPRVYGIQIRPYFSGVSEKNSLARQRKCAQDFCMVEQADIRPRPSRISTTETSVWPPAGFFCSFDRGMRNRKIDRPDCAAEESFELDMAKHAISVAHHEAGHAVAGYGFGLGAGRISIVLFESGDHLICGGSYSPARQLNPATTMGGEVSKPHLAHGIMTCAGPAFERAFRICKGMPLYNRGAGKDLRQINRLSRLQLYSGKSVPYRSMVWSGAQRLVALPVAAAAVKTLADALLSQPGDVAVEAFALPAAKVRAVLREAGIAPGMFEPLQLIETETRTAA